MLRKVGRWAIELAHKHPVLDAAIIAVGAVTVVEAVIAIAKPKPSTSQTTGSSSG